MADDLNVEKAIETANAPSNAIVGTQQFDTSARRVPRTAPSIEFPDLAWAPSQADLGQKEVAQFGFDTGLVVVPQQGNPSGAIASRSAAIARRRQELEAAKQKTAAASDPYKGISDPYYSYGAEFGKYLRGDWGRFVQENADARFGGDTSAASDWLATDPEGRAAVASWSREADAVAKENLGAGERAREILTDYQDGKIDLDQDEIASLSQLLNAQDATGAPFQAHSLPDFKSRVRDAEGVISQAQFRKSFLDKFEQFAETRTALGEISKVGGKYIVPIAEKDSFVSAIDGFAEEAVALGMYGRDKQKAKEAIGKFMKDKITWDTKVVEPFESAATKEAAKMKAAGEGKTWSAEPSDDVRGVSVGEGEKGATRVVRMPFGQITGGRNENMGPRAFLDASKNSVQIRPEAVVYYPETNEYFVEGVSASDQEVTTVKEVSGRRPTPGKPLETVTMTVKVNDPVMVPLTGSNEKAMSKYAPDLDYRKAAGAKITPEKFDTKWATLKKGESLVGPDGVTYTKK